MPTYCCFIDARILTHCKVASKILGPCYGGMREMVLGTARGSGGGGSGDGGAAGGGGGGASSVRSGAGEVCGRGLHSFTLELNSSNSKTRS